ncbi:MAG TPA: ABC transporter ATP-binding protein [Steroidobacteraceae bacterium]|nr:ABC transporter ATP-binding protein [Steroidobacteraceae bacterium]
MSAPVVTARNLGKSIGRKTILHDISVDVEPGSVVGIIGKNGAGKTTLMDVLLGFSPATSGNSRIFGHDSFTLPGEIRGRIGFVPQQDELVHLLDGRQHIEVTAALLGRWNRGLTDRLQAAWDIPMDRVAKKLSGGERQKLSILLALGHEPDLLVLDEPVAALDPISRRQFLRELLEIAGSPGRTVLFSTHIVSDLERVADQIWIVREGAIAWAGPLDHLKESVVRLNIAARRSLPSSLPLQGVLSLRTVGQRATAVVSQWTEEALPGLRETLDADVDVEALSLEDLFVEFHS